MKHDPVNRPGDDGVGALLVGRGGQRAAGSSSGRDAARDGDKRLSVPGCSLGADRWLAVSSGSIRRALRDKVNAVASRGRSRRQARPEVVRGTVITQTAKQRMVEVIRRVTQGEAFPRTFQISDGKSALWR